MKKKKGFLLVGVLFVFMFLLMIVPVMVKWIQNDTKISVKDQQSSFAFSLAEAAVDRGYWKVKSSTSTFAGVLAGGVMTGYNFDVKYTDITGGTYRVRVTSGPAADQVTVTGEGRDALARETRSIQAIYTNTPIAGAIIAGGALTAGEASVVHWGPIMALADINVTGGAQVNGYPRKLSRQTVKPFDSTNDTNPPNTDSLEWWSNYNVPELPVFDFNTMRSSAAQTSTLNCQDVITTTETYTVNNAFRGTGCTDPGWWCDCTTLTFQGTGCSDAGNPCDCVNGTYGSGCVDTGRNCNCTGSGAGIVCLGSGCTDSGANCDIDANYSCSGSACTDPGANCVITTTPTCTGSACTDSGANCDAYSGDVTTDTVTTESMQCCHSATYGGAVTCDYGGTGCTDCAVSDLYDNTTWYSQSTRRDKDYTWYWDQNATWSGSNGIRGTVVVRGNLAIDGDDNYFKDGTVKVPANAWKEYQKYDTTTVGQYPADLGKSSSAVRYTLGANDSGSASGSPSLITAGELWRMPEHTSGLGADLGVYGFLYIGGNFTRTGDSDIYGAMWVVGDVSGSGNTMVFYDSSLKLPTLNVILTQESWVEKKPSAQAWP